ncbi:MAG: ABC transporter ATP-binding protein [candidate division NC10 bacterium]|nr:ABC transporter ATP-binding protein [candidate division NC10 bacterium]
MEERGGRFLLKAAEVHLEKVSKCFGEVWAVRNVSLHIRQGEFYTFLGPSGCGKTTLLRIIAGFVEPDGGEVFLDKEAVTRVPPWKRDVGMVFQNYALWPHMAVFDNVAFGLREREVPKSEIKARVLDALKKVNLEGLEARRPSELSGGQQQRVALARTLVIEPRVLLLDEPLSNLDAKLRLQMRNELVKLQKDLGITTIYVTHDQEEALTLSNRIAVMNQGSVIQVGSPREIYGQPQDPFVAEFVGTSNFFPGEVVEAIPERLLVKTQEGTIEVAIPENFWRGRVGEPVLLSVRPEAIQLRLPQEEDHNKGNRFLGTVKTSAFQGPLVLYEVELKRGTNIKVISPNPKGGEVFRVGEEIAVLFETQEVTIIPAGSGV